MILTSDWHLTDKKDDEYRWAVFSILADRIMEGEHQIYMLGDLGDKKDKHSAELVNRLFAEINRLWDLAGASGLDLDFSILLGNHDKATSGKPFWACLDDLKAPCSFFYEPTRVGDQMFLPYSDNPGDDWANLDWDGVKVGFAHQTFTGAISDSGKQLEGLPHIPKFPSHVKVYSGDIHTPQVINWGAKITYVGAPHPVRFGDEHQCRMLRIDPDADYEIIEIIDLDPPQKLIVEISSVEQLKDLHLRAGDKARIRYNIPVEDIEHWIINERLIKSWAIQHEIEIASIEPIIERYVDEKAVIIGFDNAPDAVLEGFASSEGIDPSLLAAGRDYLSDELQ